jgi:hypothetical protein
MFVIEASPTGESRFVEIDRAIPNLARLLSTPHEHPQPWVVALPKQMLEPYKKAAVDSLRSVREQPLTILEHQVAAPFTGRLPWVLFVDGDGVLRAAAAVDDPGRLALVTNWSRKFRAR